MEKILKSPSLVLNVNRKYDTTLIISLMCQLGDVALPICGIGVPQLFHFFYLEQEKFTVTNLKTENLRCFKIQGSLRADLLSGRIAHPTDKSGHRCAGALQEASFSWVEMAGRSVSESCVHLPSIPLWI